MVRDMEYLKITTRLKNSKFKVLLWMTDCVGLPLMRMGILKVHTLLIIPKGKFIRFRDMRVVNW